MMSMSGPKPLTWKSNGIDQVGRYVDKRVGDDDDDNDLCMYLPTGLIIQFINEGMALVRGTYETMSVLMSHTRYVSI